VIGLALGVDGQVLGLHRHHVPVRWKGGGVLPAAGGGPAPQPGPAASRAGRLGVESQTVLREEP
jgi:hypothetical protein